MVHVLITGGSGFIGECLSRQLVSDSIQFTNFDTRPPASDLKERWQDVSLLDFPRFRELFERVSPSHVVHLAAETEARGQVKKTEALEKYFPTNIIGTRNLVRVANRSEIQRLVAASTSFVDGPSPRADIREPPHTDYGRSKLRMESELESLVRPWVVSRPTYVWGASLRAGCTTLLRQIERGVYFHPSGKPVVRSYCYVENLCAQLQKLLFSPNVPLFETYVGCDQVVDSRLFVNRLSVLLRGHPVRSINPNVLTTMGIMFDSIRWIPLNRFRAFHMTHDFVVDTVKADSVLQPYLMDQEETLVDFEEKWRLLKEK